ncbi:catechol 2,3-dioxygenase-like lactoylglutathione lyase family enzyme [Lewinella marina]|uniref:Glyoxalase/bleomycin resistance/dioxygenase family protein n=1 Tax=Neolewinella marina TaxID=438751 RepID=A0A2G0CII6_9BACT|nr:VOC family protein [Neolewinella marina]NJB85092.1 catechol 2,3-dioxygenase-like lactoylglutathione lyase family enzyme [Neolewinella marina]PHK99768.1 glyoxalase/bleomycin resistance/dioxygenase family protein [Neolewinella marina]
MVFEHLALNVPDPVAVARWYVSHLDARVLSQGDGPVHTTFLADSTGRVFLEVYYNPLGEIDDFAERHPLTFHFALQTSDAAGLRDSLTLAGAEVVEEICPEPGTHLVMLRDPFGIPLQLCQRRRPYPTGVAAAVPPVR